MNKNVIIGIVLALVVVSVFVVLVVSYTGKGNSLATAVTGGSCAGTSSCSPQQMAAGCGSGSAGCSSGKTSCGGGSSPYYDPGVDYGKIEKEAVAFYSQKTGDSSVMAKAFGKGDINVVIYKNKQILEQYKYENGKFVK